MFAIINSGDFHNRRLTFQPDTENVLSSVDVPIVVRPAVTALPVSYSKRTHTFRTAVGNNPAARARLGSEPFIDFNKHSVVPSGFIRKLCSEHRPARIQDGFRHLGFCKCSRVHIANDDQAIFTNDPRGLFMQMVFSGVRNLGVNSPDTTLILGPLSLPQRDFVFPVVTKRRNRIAVATRRQRLEAKVYADGAGAGWQIIHGSALIDHIPAASRIFCEAAAKKISLDFSGLPKSVSLLEVNGGVFVDFYGALNKRHPAERPFRPKACAEPRAASVLVTGLGKLSAYGANRVGVYAKVARTTGGKFYKIKSCWPKISRTTPASAFRFALRGDTEIPHLIASNRVLAKATISTLDPEFVAQNRHAPNLVGMPKVFKRELSIRTHFTRIAAREAKT